MIAYLTIDFSIFLFYLFSRQRSKQNSKKTFLFLCALLLIFFSAFRGNFTSDYDNYIDLYNNYENVGLLDILSRKAFSYPEKGYLVFQFFTKSLTNNVLFIFVFSSIFIVLVSLFVFGKYTSCSLVSVLLFVEMGGYYTSFNTSRQIIAVCIALLSIKYLLERKPIKYLLVIFIASLFHTSALVMVPFYFILNINFGKKGLIVMSVVTLSLFILLPSIISFIQKYYWSWYGDDGYGMQGYTFTNAIPKLAIALFGIVTFFLKNKNTSHKKDKLTTICLNASYFLVAFSILGLRVAMVDRITSFFMPFAIILFTNQILRYKNRQFFILMACILLVLYGVVTKMSFPYRFVWQS